MPHEPPGARDPRRNTDSAAEIAEQIRASSAALVEQVDELLRRTQQQPISSFISYPFAPPPDVAAHRYGRYFMEDAQTFLRTLGMAGPGAVKAASELSRLVMRRFEEGFEEGSKTDGV